MDDREINAQHAQAMQNEATRLGKLIMWAISEHPADHP
jgi:hypothetical protein